ncbi:MAG: hypothetical protein AAGC67_12735 [Myxococcota bacterium]
MSDTMYTPPDAELVGDAASDEGRHYVVGVRKFLLLSLATLNLYQVYWFWRNFRNLRDASGESFWPVPRAIFSIFFTHGLFRDVDETLRSKGLRFAWSADPTAAAVISLNLVSGVGANLTGRLAEQAPVLDLVFMGIGLLVPFATLPAQRAINLANGDPEGATNADLTAANWLWLVFGLIFWATTVFGYFLILTGAELDA